MRRLHPWRQVFLERRCLACSGPFLPEAHAEFCPDCAAAMPRRTGAFCPICGEIYEIPEAGLICPGCQERRPPWGRVYFHGAYEGLLRALILRLKFGKELHLARGLALLLCAHPELADAVRNYDLIIPVPLHPKRLYTRGFNQSGEIAAAVGRELHVPVAHALTRTLPTGGQVGRSRRERVKNLSGAFTAQDEVAGKKILLLDDVMTTGATMASAARSLLNGGAILVDALVPARTRARNMLRESRNL